MAFTIKRNTDIPMSLSEKVVKLIEEHITALDSESNPNGQGIARMVVPVMVGAGGPGLYVGVAVDAAGEPIAVGIGYAMINPTEAEQVGNMPMIAMKHTNDGIAAAGGVVTDFEDWAKERYCTVMRVEFPKASPLPALPEYQPSAVAYTRRIEALQPIAPASPISL